MWIGSRLARRDVVHSRRGRGKRRRGGSDSGACAALQCSAKPGTKRDMSIGVRLLKRLWLTISKVKNAVAKPSVCKFPGFSFAAGQNMAFRPAAMLPVAWLLQSRGIVCLG